MPRSKSFTCLLRSQTAWILCLAQLLNMFLSAVTIRWVSSLTKKLPTAVSILMVWLVETDLTDYFLKAPASIFFDDVKEVTSWRKINLWKNVNAEIRVAQTKRLLDIFSASLSVFHEWIQNRSMILSRLKREQFVSSSVESWTLSRNFNNFAHTIVLCIRHQHWGQEFKTWMFI